MGVRGLTSYIAQHAEQFLKPYELHDCNLVIDGDNLACNLYKDCTGTYSAFTGDYDDFYRAVLQFFHILAECNISAYVLLDGGYEQRKLRTVASRLRGKISVIKKINPAGSITVFPVLLKEVFVQAVQDSGVPVMRCIFEADDELAALGRKLNCPVLSYDSDFYIHNVKYIPLITLTPKVLTKQVRLQHNNETAQRLRKNAATHMQKRTKRHCIIKSMAKQQQQEQEHGDSVADATVASNKITYKYLDCCIYRIQHLLSKRALSKEKLPLFAALLGNDYIARSSFRNFFLSGGLGKIGRSRKLNQQQRRIRLILQWLKHETLESALQRILVRLKQSQRSSLLAQVQAATAGYSNEVCHSYDFFKANYENAFSEFMNDDELSADELEDESEEATDSEIEEVEEIEEEEIEEEENEEEEIEEEAYEEVDELNEMEEDAEEICDDDEENDNAETADGELKVQSDSADKSKQFPQWFLNKLYAAQLPRFMVDLVHLRKYINSPQIEHFAYDDCNEVALPILEHIFTLLNSVQGAETQPAIAEDGNAKPIEFTYLTRAKRVTNIRYQHIEMKPLPNSLPAFDVEKPNAKLLRCIFEQNMPKLNAKQLFEQVQKLPKDLRLYFLAIVYWLQKSQHCDLLHLHALLITLVVLRTIDSRLPVERDLRAFQKRYGKRIKEEKATRAAQTDENVSANNNSNSKLKEPMPMPARIAHISKADCLLVMNHLLKHFHMQEIFKKKYDLYSSSILHAFAEFQAILFQLNALNALLSFPYASPRMSDLYCGVFLYNIYDLLSKRLDLRYFVQHFIFQDSALMFDFYCFLYDWCDAFVPVHKRLQLVNTEQSALKKMQKKKRQAARKQHKVAAAATTLTNDAATVELVDYASAIEVEQDDEFFDLNNKFCTLLKMS